MKLSTVVIAALAFAAPVFPASAQVRQAPPSAPAMKMSFAPVVKRVAPAVVNVYASRTVSRPSSPFADDPFFRRFFGGEGPLGQPSARVQRSLGSGVVIDPAGIIVTNNHVIANADEVKVALSDGREFDSEIVMKDDKTDLAVIRIKGLSEKLAFVEFANSDQIEVGDLVLAIGDPFGVGQTVTSGIVSGLARTQVGKDGQFFIQTDAAINPGNSGGALVDVDGRLIGINTAIFSRGGGSDGIGFAIPSNLVKLVTDSARSGKKLQRPWVGARFQAVTSDLAQGLGVDRPTGALVTALEPNGPAAKAGLQAGDVVVSIDGLDVADPGAFGYRIATAGVGHTIRMGLIRDGKPRELQMALAAAPETVPRDQKVIGGRSPFTGATVVNLSPAVAEELGYAGQASQGVIVTSVADGTPADQVGIQAGDLVAEINGATVDSTASLDAISKKGARIWRFAIERDGKIRRGVIGG